MDNKYLTNAVKEASNGNRYKNKATVPVMKNINGNRYKNEATTRAKSLYGFKNKALNMSSKEIKDAWKQASIDIKAKRQ